MAYHYVWLTLAVIFILVEIFTAGFFYACFAVGALAAWVISLITGNVVWQIVVFCAVSVGLIPVSRIFARKVTDHSVPQAGVDALIGMTGVVTENIRPSDDVGKVRVDNQSWRAVASEDIDAGAKIKVTAVRGARLVVQTAGEKGVSNE
jgi:membrane protein implicated in regulation of membrane protease activity